MKKKAMVIMTMFFVLLVTVFSANADDRVCFAKGNDALVAKWAAEDIYNEQRDVGYNSDLPIYVATHKTKWGLKGTKVKNIVLTQSTNPDFYIAKGMANTYFAIIQFPSKETKKNFSTSELAWSQVHLFAGEEGVKKKGNGNFEYFCE